MNDKMNGTKVTDLMKKIYQGNLLNREDLIELVDQPLEELCLSANEIRKKFCGDTFDFCTIINGKSGRCSEDCKYCAQASCYNTNIEQYALLPKEKILEEGKKNEQAGIKRYSIVTSGRALSDREVDDLCESINILKKETDLSVCISAGLLDKKQFMRLKEAGVSRVHNNLESSRRYFQKVCSTHTYDDKITTIKAAISVGLEVCSGGIMGLGETMEDRIDMALTARSLGVKSIPVNMLNPIHGTPYESNQLLTNDEMRRIVAIFRFAVPDGYIRLAGGRGLLEDKGRKCFCSGANAAISGDMLTTSGITYKADKQMIKELI